MSVELQKNKEPIINILQNAENYIKLVVFQLTSERIINLLLERIEEGIDVKIITLPSDSYRKEEERQELREKFQKIRQADGELLQCMWEVGQPSLTDTSESGEIRAGGGEKWYSLHGKFIVTDKKALIMSTNLIEDNEWEVYSSFEEEEKIDEFNKKFQFLRELFIQEKEGLPGKIVSKLTQEHRKTAERLFREENRLNVVHYNPDITPKKRLKPGLYICPFEGRARHFLYQIIDNAKKFVYLCAERLYDDGLVAHLTNKVVNSDLEVKIVANPPKAVRQNIPKAEDMALQLLSAGVEFAMREDVHAKLWMSEDWIAIGSANLTKMNLGFNPKGEYWRANTEVMLFENSEELIRKGKEKFERFYSSTEGGVKFLSKSSRTKGEAKDYFDLFDHYSRDKAKVMLGKFKTKFSIQSKSKTLKIASYAAKIAKAEEEYYIQEKHVIMGGILLFLQERRHTEKELVEKIGDIVKENKIANALKLLQNKEYIEKQDEFYLINIEATLLKDSKQSTS